MSSSVTNKQVDFVPTTLTNKYLLAPFFEDRRTFGSTNWFCELPISSIITS